MEVGGRGAFLGRRITLWGKVVFERE
jgi:hypothetical protein